MNDDYEYVPPPSEPCPKCQGKGIPMMYGMPCYEARLASERGEVILQGCMVSPWQDDEGVAHGPPAFRCSVCDHAFGEEKFSLFDEDEEELEE